MSGEKTLRIESMVKDILDAGCGTMEQLMGTLESVALAMPQASLCYWAVQV